MVDGTATVEQAILRLQNQISHATKGMMAAAREANDKIAKQIQDAVKAIEDSAPEVKRAYLSAATYGWFLDPSMSLPTIRALADAYQKGRVAEADEALCDYFTKKLDDCEVAITGAHPQREDLVREAFLAHREKRYGLSIPLLLAQADGICYDTVNQSFFRGADGRPSTAVHVAGLDDSGFVRAMLAPLEVKTPINFSEGEREPDSVALNRHLVLHGLSLEYATEANGLQAISLLNYVAGVLNSGPEGP